MLSPPRSALRCALVGALLACALPAPAQATRVRSTTLISIDAADDGTGNGGSAGRSATRNDATAVTPDGRYIAFTSTATDLVNSPSGAAPFVYRRDVRTGQTTLVAASGADPSISADGRYVAFASTATNLVGGFTDSDGGYDVYVRDIQGAATKLVSHQAGAPTTGGAGSSRYPVISGDGSTIVYQDAGSITAMVSPSVADTNGAPDLLTYSVGTAANKLVTANPDDTDTQSGTPGYYALSRNGSFVAYQTTATPSTVVSGLTDGNGAGGDVYRRELSDGTTIPVSISTTPNTTGDGDSAPPGEPLRISDDGRYIAFASAAATLTSAADANTGLDVFVRDVDGSSTTLISATPAGNAGNAVSHRVVMSADGHHVAFVSQATDLVSASDTGTGDVFARDVAGTTATLVSVSAGGSQAEGGSEPSISNDGRYVAFTSSGTNLIAGLNDGNGAADVFVRDMAAGTLLLVSANASASTTTGDNASSQAWVSGDGRSVTFASQAGNLVAPFADHDGIAADLYWRGLKLDPAAAISADTTSGTAPLTVTFTATSANPDLAVGYAWDFGSGASPGANSQSHTFTTAGAYTVSVKITDADGDTATASLPVSVAAPPAGSEPAVVVPDTTAPKLKLSGSKTRKIWKAIAYGLRGGVGSDENCTAHFVLTIAASSARKLGLGRSTTTIGTLTRPVAGRVATAYTVHLTKAAKRRLGQKRKVKNVVVTVTATCHDAAGNQAKPAKRTVTLVR